MPSFFPAPGAPQRGNRAVALGRTELEVWAPGRGSPGGGCVVISTRTAIMDFALQVCLSAGGPEHFLEGETHGSFFHQKLGERHLPYSTPLKCFSFFSRSILATALPPHRNWEGWSSTRPFLPFIPAGLCASLGVGEGRRHFQADSDLPCLRQACLVL